MLNFDLINTDYSVATRMFYQGKISIQDLTQLSFIKMGLVRSGCERMVSDQITPDNKIAFSYAFELNYFDLLVIENILFGPIQVRFVSSVSKESLRKELDSILELLKKIEAKI